MDDKLSKSFRTTPQFCDLLTKSKAYIFLSQLKIVLMIEKKSPQFNRKNTFRIRASSNPPFWSRSTSTRRTSMLSVSMFSLSDSVTFTWVLLSLVVSLRLSSEPYTTEKRRNEITNNFMINAFAFDGNQVVFWHN